VTEPIHADDAVLEGIREEFRRLGTELANAGGPVRVQADRVSTGAGQFADDLADGVTAFQLSWAQALDATSHSAGSIAANVGGFRLDLEKLDLASS
jgi:hypothetical protein